MHLYIWYRVEGSALCLVFCSTLAALVSVIPGLCSLSLRSLRGWVIYGTCRGIVTADVLELGLSRGAIVARKLEGVNAGQRTRGFILVRPLKVKVKAYVQLRWY